jgi:hypothetical protein
MIMSSGTEKGCGVLKVGSSLSAKLTDVVTYLTLQTQAIGGGLHHAERA